MAPRRSEAAGNLRPHFPRLAVFACSFALVACAGFSRAGPAEAFEITPSRPRLFFTSADLPMLRERTQTTHAKPWEVLRSWEQREAGAFREVSGRDDVRTHVYIERNAFLYLMLAESDPERAGHHGQVAKDWLLELAEHAFPASPNTAMEYLWAMAIGYDWLYSWPGFSAAEKRKVRDRLVERTDVYVKKTGIEGFARFPLGPAAEKSIYDNQTTENNLANALVGLALWEPDDEYGTNLHAQRYLDAARARLEKAYEATDTHAPDGGYWEGQGYAGARLQGEVYFAYAWKVATGEDLFAGNRHMRNAVYYWIYGLRPGGRSTHEGDQTCLPAGCDRNRFLAEILARAYSDGYAQWYAQYRGARAGGDRLWSDLPFDWQDIVFYDPRIPVREPSTLPLHRSFHFGLVVIRTGWDLSATSSDTHLTFSIHDWISGHTHLDANAFAIFRKGALAIDSGRYRGTPANRAHERNYAIRTIAHNTITVYRPGEDFGSLSNDGGQELLWQERKRSGDPIALSDLAGGTRFDTATLAELTVGDGFYYVKGDATDAYHSTGLHAPSDASEAKISRFTRELAFFPAGDEPVVVVFDSVRALEASWPKKWLLHAIEEPVVAGEILQVEVPNAIERHAGDRVTLRHDRGKLFAQVLLPADAVIRKVGGPGYDPLGDDVARADEEAGAWRVEISPRTPAQDDLFLNVLTLADASTSSVPAASLIEGDGVTGAAMKDRVVVFRTGDAPLANARYAVTSGGSSSLHHLVTGLAPGTYDILQDGRRIGGGTVAKDSSTLTFTASGGGTFQVSRD